MTMASSWRRLGRRRAWWDRGEGGSIGKRRWTWRAHREALDEARKRSKSGWCCFTSPMMDSGAGEMARHDCNKDKVECGIAVPCLVRKKRDAREGELASIEVGKARMRWSVASRVEGA